jgi:hypothetical protein
MAIASQVYQDRLKAIKANIYDSFIYFKPNRDYFNNTRKFVLKTNIPPQVSSALQELQRPQLEFNSLEAYVSRQLGEFAENTPGIEVSSNPSDKPPAPIMVDFIEDHMRDIIDKFNSYEVYRDQMTGGFSCLKVWTEYENEHSFNQNICLDRCYDPLLVFFDPSAQKSHKGDGSYCGEMIPISHDQFKELYPEVDLSDVYTPELEGFQWGYSSSRRRFVLVCDYYEKKSKKTILYRLSDNRVRTKKEYEEILAYHDEPTVLEQAPTIIEKRMTSITYVCRYRLIKNKVLEYRETDFSELPLIFVDGNSVTVRQSDSNSPNEQITKAYVHNAIDVQKLKNVSGQTIANAIETLTQSKMKIAWESIPDGYEDAYKNPQMPNNIIYKAYKDDGITPLPAPQEVIQVPLPPDVLNTFMNCDKMMQYALGSYDAQMGIQGNNVSGRAIIEGATQSNSAAKPFVVNFLDALQQASNIILNLIPKLYVTPRSIPIITKEGKREHVSVGNPGDPKSLKIEYSPADLNVSIVPGVNFDVQKNRALQTLEGLSQVFPSISAMINQKGLPIIFDNLDIKGADQLKKMAEEWTEEQEAKLKANQGEPNPVMMKLQMDQQNNANKDQNEKTSLSLKAQEVGLKQQEVGIKQQAQNLSDAMAQINAMNERIDSLVQMQKNATERQVHGLNAAIQVQENEREHTLKTMEHAHKVKEHIHNAAMDLVNSSNAQNQNNEDSNI